MTIPGLADVPAGLPALLVGKPLAWDSMETTPAGFLAACDRHDVSGLVHTRLAGGAGGDWPASVREAIAGAARAETAREMVRGREVASVLGALAVRGVRAVLIKGTALAYTVYDDPIARPRLDTDLLIDAADKAASRAALEDCGYAAPPYCDELFAQFQMQKTDAIGVPHVFDVHWKISTQPVFADVLSYRAVCARAQPVPALGPEALAPAPADSLLLACIHPVMHHQNAARLLWIYDIHLLASALAPDGAAAFARQAVAARVAEVCAQQLRLAQMAFGTPVPDGLLDTLAVPGAEPSAAYLASERRWHHDAASSLRALPRAGDRMRFVREVLFPRPRYILGAYGLADKPLAAWLLPALYLHRLARGGWKILTGKK